MGWETSISSGVYSKLQVACHYKFRSHGPISFTMTSHPANHDGWIKVTSNLQSTVAKPDFWGGLYHQLSLIWQCCVFLLSVCQFALPVSVVEPCVLCWSRTACLCIILNPCMWLYSMSMHIEPMHVTTHRSSKKWRMNPCMCSVWSCVTLPHFRE